MAGCLVYSCWHFSSSEWGERRRFGECWWGSGDFWRGPIHGISFLWYNVIGCVVVVGTALLLTGFRGSAEVSANSATARLGK